MKIKFKKILPILGLLSIGVAAPIISTACSSTSEMPNTDQNKPGQDGEGNNQQQPIGIKVNITKFNNFFAALDNVGYGELSQHIDPTNNNQLEQDFIGKFITSLGLNEDDANKFDKITVSLKEKLASSDTQASVSLFEASGGGTGETQPAKTLLNAEIVMTLKDRNTWNTEGLPEGSVSDDKKTLTLKDVETKVKIDEIIIDSTEQTNLESKITDLLKTLTDETDEKKLEVAGKIKETLNLWNPITKLTEQPNTNINDKVVSKVLIELVEGNTSELKTNSGSSGTTQNVKKANVIIIFGENVRVKLDSSVTPGVGVGGKEVSTTNSKFELYNNSKSAIKTTNPIDTGIKINQTAPGEGQK